MQGLMTWPNQLHLTFTGLAPTESPSNWPSWETESAIGPEAVTVMGWDWENPPVRSLIAGHWTFMG